MASTPSTDYSFYWHIDGGVFLGPARVDDLYTSAGLSGLLTRLSLFCRGEQALIVVTGEPGTGKSTLLRWLAHTLPVDSHDVLLTTMIQRETTAGWLTPRLAELLGAPSHAPAAADLREAIRDVAAQLDELRAERRRLVVAVDAAHLATTTEALSELAAYLNLQALQAQAGTCLSFVLVGDPALRDVLESTPELATKVAFNLALPRLTAEETEGYVAHRLRQAGLASPFDAEALSFLHLWTRGVMASINALAENCLVEAFQRGERRVTADLARAAAKHLARGERPEDTLPPAPAGEKAERADAPSRSEKSGRSESRDRRTAEAPTAPAETPAESDGISLTSLFKLDR